MNRGLNPDLGLAILRVVLGVILISHGAPQLFGGLGAMAVYFRELGIPLPLLVAWLVALLKFFGGIALILGFLVTPIALLMCADFLATIVLVHARNGWYVADGGVEFGVLLVAGLLTLVFAGPGLAAIDARGNGDLP